MNALLVYAVFGIARLVSVIEFLKNMLNRKHSLWSSNKNSVAMTCILAKSISSWFQASFDNFCVQIDQVRLESWSPLTFLTFADFVIFILFKGNFVKTLMQWFNLNPKGIKRSIGSLITKAYKKFCENAKIPAQKAPNIQFHTVL